PHRSLPASLGRSDRDQPARHEKPERKIGRACGWQGHGIVQIDGWRACHQLLARMVETLILVREQPGHALSIAERKRCADAHRLRAVVYPMADEVEPAGTEALQFERIA